MGTIRHNGWRWYLALCLIGSSALVDAGELADRDFSPQSYAYSDHRNFYVFVPESYDGQRPMPMVMVLHGCHQTRHTVIDEFGWDSVAEQYGFILVAPDISTNDLFRNPQCWGYWESKEIHQGQGEVEDLHRIGRQVESEWRIDPNRRHIAGLSSGGFMANAAAVAHNEYWASAGVHSGGGYNESAGTYATYCSSPRAASGRFNAPATIASAIRAEMNNDFKIPVMLVHSLNDCSVGYGVEGDPSQWGGLTSNRDAWLTINGGALFSTTDCSRGSIACRHQKFGDGAQTTLEVVRIEGLIHGTEGGKGHYWSGGKANSQWTKTQGPDAVKLFWDFFQRHPRNGCRNCPQSPVNLSATEVNENSVSLSWRAQNDENLSGFYLYRDGRKIRPTPLPGATYRDDGLIQATTYSYHVTAVNGVGAESLPSNMVNLTTHGGPNCQSYPGRLDAHVIQQHAYAQEACSGWWCWIWPFIKTTHYYAAGSDEYLGSDDNALIVLYSSDGTTYKTTACNGGG